MVISILVASSFVLLIYLRPSPIPSFEWNVQQGDMFTFSITVHSSMNYTELNNTQMTIEVNWLPGLSNEWNSSEFISEVFESGKTSLILPIIHENGTEINSTFANSINNIVSSCILPIGGWDILDQFFPNDSDTGDYGYYCDTYYSSAVDNAFSIGYVYFNIDAGFGWDSQIDRNTGVPREVRIWKYGMNVPLETYDITLRLQTGETV